MSSPRHTTIVYIDGYNLYYGRLKGTPHKWLDVFRLFQDYILPSQYPRTEVIAVKYFTSRVKTNFSSHGPIAQNSQDRYHQALCGIYPSKLEIIYGFHQAEFTRMPKYHGIKGPVDRQDTHKVWRLNEKQTDVNIALHMYRDAQKGAANALVVCSNDTDLEPALKMINEEKCGVEIGIVIPIHPSTEGKLHRPPNQKLSSLANWTRSHINNQELVDSQLPGKVRILSNMKEKIIKKPDYW